MVDAIIKRSRKFGQSNIKSVQINSVRKTSEGTLRDVCEKEVHCKQCNILFVLFRFIFLLSKSHILDIQSHIIITMNSVLLNRKYETGIRNSKQVVSFHFFFQHCKQELCFKSCNLQFTERRNKNIFYRT